MLLRHSYEMLYVTKDNDASFGICLSTYLFAIIWVATVVKLVNNMKVLDIIVLIFDGTGCSAIKLTPK